MPTELCNFDISSWRDRVLILLLPFGHDIWPSSYHKTSPCHNQQCTSPSRGHFEFWTRLVVEDLCVGAVTTTFWKPWDNCHEKSAQLLNQKFTRVQMRTGVCMTKSLATCWNARHFIGVIAQRSAHGSDGRQDNAVKASSESEPAVALRHFSHWLRRIGSVGTEGAR